jgi:hypothetical protein
MARPSTIDRLPKEVREAIGRLREDGRSIDEILAKLAELAPDAEISRSALGRHVKTLAQVGERMRRSRAMAEALTARFGEEPDDQVARLNFQLLHGIVFELLTRGPGSEDGEDGDEDGEGMVLDAAQAKALAATLRDITTAQKSDADRTLKMRAEIRKEIERENAKKIEQAVNTGDIDAEAAERARRILGFV